MTTPPSAKTVAVPEGAKIFCQDVHCRPCGPGNAAIWCWEGGERWYRVEKNPVPTKGVVFDTEWKYW